MKRGADLICARRRGGGVAEVLAMPAGGSNLDRIEAARRLGMPFVLTATETAGAIAAIAQAEISGRPGACLTTLGPGVASVVNGVACARLERAPLLVLTDSHSAATGNVFAHQRLDHHALLAPMTKWSATITADSADEIVEQAIAGAIAPPPGPVHLECPPDVTTMPFTGPGIRNQGPATPNGACGHTEPRTENPRRGVSDSSRRGGGPAAIERNGDFLIVGAWKTAQSAIARARKPLLVAGLGARRPMDVAAIRSLCERHALPAMVTYKAKGVVPDGDPPFAGVFTNGRILQRIADEADLLIGVGLDPVELLPRPWRSQQPIVCCGPGAGDARHVPVVAQLIGGLAVAPQPGRDAPREIAWDLGAGGPTLLPRTAADHHRRLQRPLAEPDRCETAPASVRIGGRDDRRRRVAVRGGRLRHAGACGDDGS